MEECRGVKSSFLFLQTFFASNVWIFASVAPDAEETLLADNIKDVVFRLRDDEEGWLIVSR